MTSGVLTDLPLRRSDFSSAVWQAGVTLFGLDLDHAALHAHREGLHGNVGRQVQRLSALQVEHRAVARALDGAPRLVELALEEDAVVVGAAVLDGVEGPRAVEDADRDLVEGDVPHGPGRELGFGAHVDPIAHGLKTLLRLHPEHARVDLRLAGAAGLDLARRGD